MRWANSVTKHLPYMKHMENSLDALPKIPKMNKPFSKMEMCMNIIATLPLKISLAYWAAKSQHFPICLQSLGGGLKLVEAQEKR